MADDMAQEVWRPAPGFEGDLEVSSLGRVRTVFRRDANGHRWPAVTLTLCPSNLGYLFARPRIRCRRVSVSVHRSVARAFLGPPNGLEVNHKSGIKADNRVENLEYVTRSENMKHAFRLGLVTLPNRWNGDTQKIKTIGTSE